jgi:penicillin G amidase
MPVREIAGGFRMRWMLVLLLGLVGVGCGSSHSSSGAPDGGSDASCAHGDEACDQPDAGNLRPDAGKPNPDAGPDASCVPGDQNCAPDAGEPTADAGPDASCVPGDENCDPSDAGRPTLSISPSDSGGPVPVTGPTQFTAVLENSSAHVRWSVEGGGTLSSTTGSQVTFTPPLGSATETLTAKADGVTASVQIASSPPALIGATIPGLTAAVTVSYDGQDIPHINCASRSDCFAAQGYVQAKDRLFQMDFLRHVARSKLSELIGQGGLAQDVQLRTLFITRAGHRLEEDLTAVMAAPTKALVTAFAGGINAYLTNLRAHPEQMPAEYAELPFPLTPADIADWAVQDTAAIMRLEQFELSESITEELSFAQFAAVYGQGGAQADPGKMAAWIRAAAPSTEQAHTLSPSPSLDVVSLSSASASTALAATPTPPRANFSEWQTVLSAAHQRAQALTARLRPMGAPVGSNNWAVAAAKSATHVSMLANDPHLALEYPPLFHLSAMTSSQALDDLNLTGGTFPGIPGALVGRGAHVSWGVTVVGYDVTDVYLEQFLPQASCPDANPCVLFNGAPASTVKVPQTYLVRIGPGASGLVDASTLSSPPPSFVLVVPAHGPVIQAPDSAGKALSVRWAGQEGNTQDITSIIGLNTAADVDAAVTALKDFSTGAQNFVLADDQGHIAYDPHALVPVRRFADARVSTSLTPPWFPLPADGSAEWGDGSSNCAAATLTPLPAACWISNAELPQGKDPAKGYYFTANSDPTWPSVSDDNNPLAHPPYLSFDWDDSTGFRATRIQQRLEQALSVNSAVSLADMESIQTDHVSRPGKAFADYIATLPTNAADPANLVAARAVLAAWASNGYDCPTGLLGVDPNKSAGDTTPAISQSSTGCFFFHAFLRILLTNVFSDDLAVAGQGVSDGQALKAMLFMLGLDATLSTTGSKFCNDVNASGTLVTAHTCAEQVLTALASAESTLASALGQPTQWVWGRAHTLSPVSSLSLSVPTDAAGPYARAGGAFTVDVGAPSLTGSGLDFSFSAGSNVRHISIMDPARPVVKMQLPGPERDATTQFVSPLLGQWLTNTYFDFAFGDQINSTAVSTQPFTSQ